MQCVTMKVILHLKQKVLIYYKMTHKRKNYLEWQEYFMSIAFLSAQRSKDPTTQVQFTHILAHIFFPLFSLQIL